MRRLCLGVLVSITNTISAYDAGRSRASLSAWAEIRRARARPARPMRSNAAVLGSTNRSAFINASDETAAVTATAFDTAGVKMAPGFTTRISPQTMEELDWAAILGTGSLRQGYFVLDVVQADRPHPFASVPHLAGAVSIEAPGSRTASALSNEIGDEFFFTPVRSDEDEYTGLAILNEGTEEMEVLIEAYAADGEVLDSAELMVAGRALQIGLLRELLPELGAADGGYVRVTSTSIRMRALAVLGRLDGTSLLHLAAQTAP